MGVEELEDGSLDMACGADGTCNCRCNVKGPFCDECNAEFYSFPDCYECGCSHHGAVNDFCDDNGVCTCKYGFGGDKCDECANGLYGFPHCTDCSCNEQGAYSPICDSIGECSCRPNVVGNECDSCAEGHFDFPNCVACDCDIYGSIPELSCVDSGMMMVVNGGNVSCGGHYASSCHSCSMGNGASWCHGDCEWDSANHQCVNKGECLNGSPQYIGDNFCDDNNNNENCNFDGGDCCLENVNTQYCSECQCMVSMAAMGQCTCINERIGGERCDQCAEGYSMNGFPHCLQEQYITFHVIDATDNKGMYIIWFLDSILIFVY